MQRFLRLLPSRTPTILRGAAPHIVAWGSLDGRDGSIAPSVLSSGALRAASGKKKGGGGGSPYRVSPDQRPGNTFSGGGRGGNDGGGRGGGGGNSGGNQVKLQICHSDYDIDPEPEDYDDEDEDMLFTKARFDMKDIQKKVEEVFDSSKNLEYYENNAWKPLRDLGNLQKYKGGKVPLKVRVPELYDDQKMDGDDEDDDEGYKYNEGDDDEDDYSYDRDAEDDFGGGSRTSVMEDTIVDLVSTLKALGFERSDVKPLTLRQGGKEVATKEWVLQQAEKNPSLETVLLGHVGALDHVVQCLHYDMVWKVPQEDPAAGNNEEEDDDDKRKH
jgi:hypothetical protein